MITYIAILRGINVSGQKKINMNELQALFTEMGFSNVKTYIQSGNVVFTSDKAHNTSLSTQIEQKIYERYAFDVPVLIRTYSELLAVIDKNPLGNTSTDNLYVTFLSGQPLQAYIDQTSSFEAEPDKFIILGTEVYVFCPNGYGRTKLHNNFFENKLKVTATTRNWKTIHELAKMAQAINSSSQHTS